MIYEVISLTTFFVLILEVFILSFDLEILTSKYNIIILYCIDVFTVCATYYFGGNNDTIKCLITGINILIIFKKNIVRLLGIYVFICLCIYQLEISLVFLIMFIYYKANISLNHVSSMFGGCFIHVFILATYSLFYYLFRKKEKEFAKEIRETRFTYFIFIELLVLVINFLIAFGCLNFAKNYKDFDKSFYFYLLSSAMSFFLVFMGFVINQIILRNIKYKEVIEMNRRYIVQQKIYYENMIKNQDKMRRIRHDIKHHIAILQSMLSGEQYENATGYLKTMLEKLDFLKPDSLFENIIMDSVLAEYKQIIQENHIVLNIKGRYPRDLKINDYDLCVIFSNLLLNAIEACILVRDEKNRNIEIMIDRYGIYFSIIIKNTYQFISPKLHTIKMDKINHGLGLKNIMESVENNNGNIEFSYDQNLFCVEVLLQGEEE